MVLGTKTSQGSDRFRVYFDFLGSRKKLRKQQDRAPKCRQAFGESLAACVAECELTCEEQCFVDSAQQLRECIEDGGDRRECLMGAFESLRGCLEACGD